MVSHNLLERADQVVGQTRQLTFAGDGVRLAGQIDYPETSPPSKAGYPLVFILPHAGCNDRQAQKHFAQTGLNCGFAVFRWDKRGTGRSGAGGRGSTTQDAVLAYEIALEQPGVDRRHTVIIAQSEGTVMLGDAFGLFARVQHPFGVVLAGNMLDKKAIRAIDAPVQIIVGDQDWHDWRTYARDACAVHGVTYSHGTDFYVATDAGRRLLVGEGDNRVFHGGAERVLRNWLQKLCPPSR
jgi:uncharacterized protein